MILASSFASPSIAAIFAANWRRVESLIGARIKCNVDDLASDALQTYQGRDVVPIDTSLSAHNKLAIEQNAPQLASFALRFVIIGDKSR